MRNYLYVLLVLFLTTSFMPPIPAFSWDGDEGYGSSVNVDDWSGESDGQTSNQNYKGFTDELFGGLSVKIIDFHNAIYPELMKSFGGMIRIMVTLYIVFCGYGIAAQRFKEATNEMMVSLGLVIFLHSLVMESGVYSHTITPLITKFFMGMANFFASAALRTGGMSGASDAFGVFPALDEMFVRLDRAQAAIEATALPIDLVKSKALLAMMGLRIIYCFMYGAFMAIMVMGFFSLHVLYLVGGICIFFAAFKQTRFVFYSWLRGIFNYGLLIVFASIVLSICIFGINDSLAKMVEAAEKTGEVFTRQYFTTIFWAFITVAMLLKVPDFASLLSGGSAGSTAGIAAGMGLVTSSIAKGVKMGMKPAGKMGGTLADRGMRNLPGGAGRAYSYMKGLYKGDDR